MGRVEEAMRRASIGPLETTVAAPETAAPASVERFPGESRREAERRPLVAAESTVPANLLDTIVPGLAGKVVIDPSIDGAVREQYRRLATSLHAAQATNGLKLVMVSSAVPEEGKSLTAANLAMTLSESYQRRVLLVDADLRLPSLHLIFGVDDGAGLTEALLAAEDGPLPLRRLSANLTLLPAGRPTAEPMQVLASERMHRLLTDARDAFDWVVIDTPPVGLLSDARMLSEAVDGVLLLVRADSTPYDIVQRAVAVVGPDRVIGLVLNRAELPEGPHYRYSRYYQALPAGRRREPGT